MTARDQREGGFDRRNAGPEEKNPRIARKPGEVHAGTVAQSGWPRHRPRRMLPAVEYRLRKLRENFGGIPLEIECLESLDHTIDELFAELEKTGNAALL